MIDLATTLLTPAPALPSAPRAALSTTSDFALALAQVSGAADVAAIAVPTTVPDVTVTTEAPAPATATALEGPSGERQISAATGTILPEVAAPAVPTIMVAPAPAADLVLPTEAHAAAPRGTAIPIAQPLAAVPALALRAEKSDVTPASADPASPDEPEPKRAKPIAIATDVAPIILPAFQPNVPAVAPQPVTFSDTDLAAEAPAPAIAPAEPASLPNTPAVLAPPVPVAAAAPFIEAAIKPAPTVPAEAPPPITLDDASSQPAPVEAVRRAPTPAPLPNVPAVAPPPISLGDASVVEAPAAPDRESPAAPEAGPSVPTAPTPLVERPLPDAIAPAPSLASDVLQPARQQPAAVAVNEPIVPARREPPAAPVPEVVATPIVAATSDKAPVAARSERVVAAPATAPEPAVTPVRGEAPAVTPTVPVSTPVASAAPSTAPLIADAPIVAAADRVVRAATQPITADAPTRPTFRSQPASAPVTVVRPAAAVAASVAPAEQPAARAFAAQLFAAAASTTDDDAVDPLRELSAAFPLAGLTGPGTAPEQVAAPVAVQGAPLDMTDDSWMTGMIDRIETLRDSAGGGSEARIRLSPDALGTVDVAITRDDRGTLQVQLSTDTPQARTMLAEAAPRLVDLAEARGLKLGGTAVDAGAGNPGGERREPHQGAPTRRRPVSARADTPSRTNDHRIA